MKLLKVKEETINLTWENGKKAKLYAVVFKPWGGRECVLGLFDNTYWAKLFINSSIIKEQLSIMEVLR